MKKIVFAMVILAGCGADGPPFVPTLSTGLTVGTGGVSTSTRVGASNGTVSVGVGL